MSFTQVLKRFFGSSPRQIVFGRASDAFEAALSAVDAYTTRAHHRYAILDAQRVLHAAAEPDYGGYQEAIAPYTDPADHQPYTAAELRAYTAVIDRLRGAFTRLRPAFDQIPRSADIYGSAAALYEACCDSYLFATQAYSCAVHCAITSALETQLQAAKDEFRVGLLEASGANPTKAAAAKANLDADVAKAKALEGEAKVAEAKAGTFLAEAESVTGHKRLCS